MNYQNTGEIPPETGEQWPQYETAPGAYYYQDYATGQAGPYYEQPYSAYGQYNSQQYNPAVYYYNPQDQYTPHDAQTLGYEQSPPYNYHQPQQWFSPADTTQCDDARRPTKKYSESRARQPNRQVYTNSDNSGTSTESTKPSSTPGRQSVSHKNAPSRRSYQASRNRDTKSRENENTTEKDDSSPTQQGSRSKTIHKNENAHSIREESLKTNKTKNKILLVNDNAEGHDSLNTHDGATKEPKIVIKQEKEIKVITKKAGIIRIDSKKLGKQDESNADRNERKKEVTGRRKEWSRKKIDHQQQDTDETQRGTLIEQLWTGSYECMVCCEVVRCEAAIWSCSNCYHVFHLRCIKKWAKTSTIEDKDSSGWRCPACQNVCERFPGQYRCFCGKERDPDWNHHDTPHSCGGLCRKSRGTHCPHACNILCHPGPCPPCHASIRKACDCGKTSETVKCGQQTHLKCDRKCQRQLNCGKHECSEICHSGPCQPCGVDILQKCFCEKQERHVTCGSQESFQSVFPCGQICNRLLECNNHECQAMCHPGSCDPCSLTPARVTHCPCGRMALDDLVDEALDQGRATCTDPIPICGAMCGKQLGCGSTVAGRRKMHVCEKKCHEGKCQSCDRMTSMTCRCGNTEKHMPCSDTVKYSDSNPLTCDRRCNKKRQCGRHKCNKLCCVDSEHTCAQICGKRLGCGLHKCDEVCHKTKCPPCWQSSFDELRCNCGESVIYPPVPCGTKPPECNNLCQRQHSCDHPVDHKCQDKCPPCTVLTEKMCMGEHQLRKNIPCHLKDISCGLACHKTLPCGQHRCLLICHKGVCMRGDDVCKQPCVLSRKCGHNCGQPCHPDTACPDTPCRAKIKISCECGARSEIVPCDEGAKKTETTSRFSNFAMQLAQASVNINQVKGSGRDRHLECDDKCALKERNRRVSLALEIKNPDLYAKLGSPLYSDFLKDFTRQFPQFVAGVEKSLSDLVHTAKKSVHAKRSHSFAPMNHDQRKFIHELAEFYGCESQSYDNEPKKNVVATAPRDKCWLPGMSLTVMVQKESHSKPPKPIMTPKACDIKLPSQVRGATSGLTTLTKLVAKKEPVIDYFDMTD